VTHWPFVAAAYATALVGTLALVAASYVAMRRAEKDVDALRDER
jgi:hypothetical protein